MSVEAQLLARRKPAGGNFNRQRFWLLTQANFVMYLRNKATIFWAMLFPIGLMLLFGAIYGDRKFDPSQLDSQKAETGNITFISYLVPGAIVMSLLANGVVGTAGAMAVWRERGILRRIQTTTLPVWQMLLSRILTQSVIMLGQAFLLIGTSIVVFGARFDGLGVMAAIPFIFLDSITSISIGQMIAALVSKAETVQVLSQLIYFPLLFLSGLMIPLSSLPDFLQTIGKWLPSAMMGNLLRVTMLNTTDVYNLSLGVSLIGVAIFLGLTLFVASRFFKW